MANNEDQQILESGLETEAVRQELEAEEAGENQAQFQEEKDLENQLAFARNVQQQEAEEVSALQKVSRSFSGPSLFKYGIILILFALPNDVIDLMDLTGIGMIVSWIVSAFLSIGSIIVTWMADSELQRVKEHMKSIQKYQQTAARTMTKVASKLLKFAPRNPVIKMAAGMVLEFIPLISILPWSCICTFLAYQDERHAFKEAKEQSDEMLSASSQVPEMV